ncbi:SNF family Na+-dependent transporter [Thiovulum sp. ES]|nr:SNF family Na+-dependent transporter [Thiovulum sp. ES]
MDKVKFTRIGFILATVGSAVGLGNIWKFPYMTGEYGGGAFVLVYLVTIFLIGMSMLIAEIFLGKHGDSDSVTVFEKVGNENKIPSLKYAGFLSFNGLIIMSFYSVVIGWILYYIWSAFNGLPNSIGEAEKYFNTMLRDEVVLQIGFHTFATLTVLHFVNGGIKKGIELLNNILIPLLILTLVSLLFYSMSFEAFSQSFDFLFSFNFDKLNSEAVVRAIGHSFFTVSLGMGAIMTYSASMPKSGKIVKSAMTIVFFDTFIALVAGLIIFTFLFQFGEEPAKGVGLAFISLPFIFSQMGEIGVYISLIFLFSLLMAGLTSSVSLVEPAVLYMENRLNVSRIKATFIMGGIYYFLGIIAILSYSGSWGEVFSIFGTPIFDILEKSSDMVLIPTFVIIIALTVGYGMRDHLSELREELGGTLFSIWLFSIRVITPIAILFFVLNLFGVIELG